MADDSEGGNWNQYDIAGWEPIGGDWRDVENGDESFADSSYEWWDVDRVTVHFTNSEGDEIYLTVIGPFRDEEDFIDAVDQSLDGYGIEA